MGILRRSSGRQVGLPVSQGESLFAPFSPSIARANSMLPPGAMPIEQPWQTAARLSPAGRQAINDDLLNKRDIAGGRVVESTPSSSREITRG